MKTLNIFMCLCLMVSACDPAQGPDQFVSNPDDESFEESYCPPSEDFDEGGKTEILTAANEDGTEKKTDENVITETKGWLVDDTDDYEKIEDSESIDDNDTELVIDTDDTETDSDSGTEEDTGTDFEEDTDSGSEVEEDTETDSETDSETEFGEDTDSDSETETGEEPMCDEWGYRDTLTNLCWEKTPDTKKKGLVEATSYCSELGEGWRVPTIDEMRSTVRSCNYVDLDGSCRVHDDCTDWECWNPEENGCMSCSRGNRTDTDDCFFWLPGFEGACYLTVYGSSTLVTNYPVTPVKMWVMNFWAAGLYSYPSEGDAPEQYVSWRCVKSL